MAERHGGGAACLSMDCPPTIFALIEQVFLGIGGQAVCSSVLIDGICRLRAIHNSRRRVDEVDAEDILRCSVFA